MTVRVGINGFGRIGRNFFRAAKERNADIDFVAVNDLGSIDTMAHLLKYDSVLGTLPYDVKAGANGIAVDGDDLTVLQEARPEEPPVGGGLRRRRRHREHGLLHRARHRRISPRGGCAAGDRVGALRRRRRHARLRRQPQGVRLRHPEGGLQREAGTTNCFVPVVKVLDDNFGVEQGLMQTVHAYTGDQMLVDGPHKDLRRARGAAINIVPTSTGAASAPRASCCGSMKGKLDGTSLRVPVRDRLAPSTSLPT